MTIQAPLLTADDLLRLPDDGQRHELVQGELRTMAPTGAEHTVITSELHWWLAQYVRAQYLGQITAAEGGFRIATNPDTVLAPDVAFIRRERLITPPPPGYWPFAPDLAAEVLSPSDRSRDVDE